MSDNPLLSRIRMPGETFRLPSGGLFYQPGVLSEKAIDGEIHVYPMTGIDEISIKTPDLLFSGNAVKQIFARCIPDVLQPGKLFAKDVDFLLICLRKVSYGQELEITYTHTCPNAKEHSYKISVDTFLRKSKRIDPNRIGNDFQVTLHNGETVKIQPISFDDFTSMMQASETDVNPETLAKRMYSAVSKVIKSVDEITNPEQIEEWLSKIPPMLTRQITQIIEKSTEWGPDFMVPIKCRECGEEVPVQAPLNPLAFFT